LFPFFQVLPRKFYFCRTGVKRRIFVFSILDEAERSFDRAIIDFNTGVEKLFDVLNMLADNHVVTNEHEKE